MAKEPKSEIVVPLRIVLIDPPPGVDFGVQEGKGNDYKTFAVQRSKAGNIQPALRDEACVALKTWRPWKIAFGIADWKSVMRSRQSFLTLTSGERHEQVAKSILHAEH